MTMNSTDTYLSDNIAVLTDFFDIIFFKSFLTNYRCPIKFTKLRLKTILQLSTLKVTIFLITKIQYDNKTLIITTKIT